MRTCSPRGSYIGRSDTWARTRSPATWPENLGGSLTIESQDTGATAVLNVVSFAVPCTEFSRYCLQRPHGHVPIPRLREAVKFLGGGRRGFLVLIDAAHQPITVRPGDRVFLDGSSFSRHPDETR
jgi:hypothetical protein